MFGHGGVIDAGSKENGDAQLGGGGDVDLIDADSVFAEDFQPGAGFLQNAAAYRIVAADITIDVAYQ